ncbi:lysozyme inhibitor LprI family protein [Cognatishimia sp. SS12]|uniref:lysozyme inhibitor LprI family protein n=1 Tax=Cognatishimia sp. SS12 TaxID=2979465 RepID=UPI0023311BD6|nr:lysozyme inhibitor LprI family protein [Cognatishimia sp. SS12]MDC0738192.1 lysozyme inhibitor LprI family protein [Cognatishimia sp. SS12]
MVRLTIALMFAGGAVAAQDVDCDNAIAQVEMNYCAHLAYQAADEDLNHAYKLAIQQARAQDQYLAEGEIPAEEMLRDAQRAWIPFRDKACALESTMARGGTMAPLLFSSCLERETRNRTESLRYFGEVN